MSQAHVSPAPARSTRKSTSRRSLEFYSNRGQNKQKTAVLDLKAQLNLPFSLLFQN